MSENASTEKPISDEYVTDVIKRSHIEFNSGNFKETCELLESPELKSDTISRDSEIMLLSQKSGYYFITGEKDKCEKNLRKLGAIQRNAGDFDSAMKSFGTARMLSPDDLSLKFEIATCVTDSGDIPVGIAKLKSLIEENPDFDEAVALLLKSSKKYRPESVVGLIPEHLRRNPENIDSYRYSLDIYEEIGQKEQAIEIREKLIDLLKGSDGLDSFVMECSRLYPDKPQFLLAKYRLALNSTNFDLVHESLAELADLHTRKGNTKKALYYTELQLLLDTKSERLIKRARELREKLGLNSSPFDNITPPKELLNDSDLKAILELDFSRTINSITTKISENLSDNMELSKTLRSILLDKVRLKQQINDEFEGKSSTPVELWAKLQSHENNTTELTELFSQYPRSKPVLKALLSSMNTEEEKINLWLDIAIDASKSDNPNKANAILRLLSQSTDNLGSFIPKIEIILGENQR